MTPADLDRLERAIDDHDTVAIMTAAPGLVAAVRDLKETKRLLACEVAERDRQWDKRKAAEAKAADWERQAKAQHKILRIEAIGRHEAEDLCFEFADALEGGTIGSPYTDEQRERLVAMMERRK